eukprot:987155-Prorocentrum_minimum.AAC.1
MDFAGGGGNFAGGELNPPVADEWPTNGSGVAEGNRPAKSDRLREGRRGIYPMITNCALQRAGVQALWAMVRGQQTVAAMMADKDS